DGFFRRGVSEMRPLTLREVAEQIADVLLNGAVRNAVNLPSVDAATAKVLGPYLDLGAKLGTLVQQLALPAVAKLRITYFGKIVDLDANAITRAIQRGYLARISGEGVNVVNAPIMLERLGLRCEIIKSTDDSDYTELILVEAVAADGSTRSAAGTLVTKANSPRIVAVNGRDVEAVATGKLLIIEND
ncbi:MAG: phosphoglycerate dehydrogenase, partial [Verrucomicrobiales bacterium VVV1]